MKLLISLLIGISLAFAGGFTDSNGIYFETSDVETMDARIDEILERFDTDHVVDSIVIDWGNWGFCEGSATPGVMLCYDEPIMIADYSVAPLKMASLGLDIGSDPSRNGYTRGDDKNSNTNFGYVNMFSLPLLGFALDDMPEFCFESGDISVAYISAFDPLYDAMFTIQAFRDIEQMFEPSVILLGIFDCVASSSQELLDSTNAISRTSDMIRMAHPANIGCWNSFPMGGRSQSPDPIIDGATSVTFALAEGMRTDLITKTIPLYLYDGTPGFPDTMCGGRYCPVFIKPQFLIGMSYPIGSRTVPIGAVASVWAEYKNSVSMGDSIGYWIWKRKCFYMGAATCNKEDDKDKKDDSGDSK